jgi:23S rRNA (pseudouridine1915-N3)-methyltransferase
MTVVITGGARLSFVVGGAEGLPPELKGAPYELLSLSKLTFTHQFARVVLAEQIYRGAEIRKGSAYHKE